MMVEGFIFVFGICISLVASQRPPTLLSRRLFHCLRAILFIPELHIDSSLSFLLQFVLVLVLSRATLHMHRFFRDFVPLRTSPMQAVSHHSKTELAFLLKSPPSAQLVSFRFIGSHGIDKTLC